MTQDEIKAFIKNLPNNYETCYNKEQTELGIYEVDDLFPKAMLNIKDADLHRNDFDEPIPSDIETALFLAHTQILCEAL